MLVHSEKQTQRWSSLFLSQLEDLCGGTQPDPNILAEVPDLKVTLELIQKAAGKQSSGQQQKPSTLTATHLLISALDGEFS